MPEEMVRQTRPPPGFKIPLGPAVTIRKKKKDVGLAKRLVGSTKVGKAAKVLANPKQYLTPQNVANTVVTAGGHALSRHLFGPLHQIPYKLSAAVKTHR